MLTLLFSTGALANSTAGAVDAGAASMLFEITVDAAPQIDCRVEGTAAGATPNAFNVGAVLNSTSAVSGVPWGTGGPVPGDLFGWRNGTIWYVGAHTTLRCEPVPQLLGVSVDVTSQNETGGAEAWWDDGQNDYAVTTPANNLTAGDLTNMVINTFPGDVFFSMGTAVDDIDGSTSSVEILFTFTAS